MAVTLAHPFLTSVDVNQFRNNAREKQTIPSNVSRQHPANNAETSLLYF
jgi:hypothetical protein